MKIACQNLTGAALDWAVARLQNVELDENNVPIWFDTDGPGAARATYSPSTNWAQGGPILEREKISPAYEPSLVYDDSCRWKAICQMSDDGPHHGPTLLIAAMRCYVASKLGDTVDIPDGLVVDA